MSYKLLIKNAKEVVQVTRKNVPYLIKDDMKNVEVIRRIENSTGISIVVGKLIK